MVFKRFIFIILVLALMPMASAYGITFTNIENSIYSDGTASYAVSIVNTNGFDDTFQISTRDPNWILSSDIMAVPSLSTKGFLLSLKPKTGLETGPHAVPIKTKSLRTGQFNEDNLLVNIKPDTPFGGDYVPAVNMEVSIDEQVDVRNKVPVNVELKNKNPRDMPELKIIIDGQSFFRDQMISLNPLEEKQLDFLFDPGIEASSGVKTLTVKLILANLTIAEVTREFEVLAFEEVDEEVTKVKNFFQTTGTHVLTNIGNGRDKVRKEMTLPFYKKLFYKFSPNPTKSDGKYSWAETLNPGESMTIIVVANYNILALVILAGILSLISYYIFRSPILLIKEAVMEKEHNGKTLIKVRVHVKNRTKNLIQAVEIMDRIPNIAEYHKVKTIGTLEPTKVVKSSTKGTSLKWETEVLDPFEERIITYKILCKLKIVGGLNLPSGRAKFHTQSGKERTSYSNSASVMERMDD
uniref:Uncharacterized protein n=1 Tax=uncultured marine group II/III euryarchaeote KM3_83_G03 TaxID=1456522 RepID=A0A075HT47_9EURY|nr:hypothetical protein [uncultured marine group II/III euryarchaeote KM3_83_G03]